MMNAQDVVQTMEKIGFTNIATVAIYANFAHTNESLVLQNSILLTAGKTP